MLSIRPVSDLRNKFPEIEAIVHNGSPVFLTKNGYGSMVVMSLASYTQLTEDVELALDQADTAAIEDDLRLSHQEVFDRLREQFHG